MFSASDYDKLQQIMEESPEKRELLSRLLDTHRTMLSSISHEIRNPLTLVYSTLQLIASQHPEVTDYKHWGQLMQDIEYMTQLLEELSSYNNSEKLNVSLVDSDTFFKTVALSFAASVADTDIEFVSRISPDLPAFSCDYIKIRQILLNLLRNAKDAVLSHPRLHPEISMDASCTHTHIIIRISDNGCGIAPEALNHIFEPFVTYKTGGTGLGLAIANRIALAHNGSLKVSSCLNGPTEFTLTLPIEQHSQKKA